MGPITEKSSKQTVNSLKPVGEAIGKIKEDHEGFVKNVEDGQKKTDTAFKKMLTGLTSIKDVTTQLNKTGVNIKTKLEGEKEVEAGLAAIKQSADSLQRGKITLTMDLENGEKVLSQLEGVDGISSRIDGDKIVLTMDLRGGAESEAQITAVQAAASGLDGDKIRMTLDVDGMPEAVSGMTAVDVLRAHLDGNNIRMKLDVDGAAQAEAELAAVTAAQAAATGAASLLSDTLGALPGRWVAIALAIVALTAAVTPLLGGLAVLGGLVTAAAAGFGLMAGGAVKLGMGLKDISDANTKVNDSTTKLEAAQQQLADALASGNEEAIAEARKQVESATDGLTKAQANLTAVTESQGRSTQKLYEAWSTFKAALPGTFEAPARDLAQLGIQLLHIATNALPAVKTAAETTGAAFKAAFRDVLDIFTSDTLKNSFQRLFDAAAPILANLTTAVGKFGAGLINIFAVATPLAITLSEKLDSIAQAFLDWTQSEAGVQSIISAMQGAVPVFEALWDASVKLAAAILEVGVNHAQDVAAFFTTLGDVLTVVVQGFDALLTAADALGPVLTGFVALGIVAYLKDWALSAKLAAASTWIMNASVVGLTGSLWSAVSAAGAFLVALAPLIALAIVVDIAVNFDWDAAQQAYTDARASGATAGDAFGQGVLAGLEGVPIVGGVTSWIDENVGKPIDNWVTAHEGWLGKALAAEEPDAQTEATNLGSLVRDALAKEEPATEQEASNLGGLLAKKLQEQEGPTQEEATNLGSIVRDEWGTAFSELADSVGEDLQRLWDNVKQYFTDGAVAEVTEGDATVQTETDTAWQAMAEGVGSALQTAWDYVVEKWTGGVVADTTAGNDAASESTTMSWPEIAETVGTALQTAWDYVVEKWTGGVVADTTAGNDAASESTTMTWPEIAEAVGKALQTAWDYVIEKYTDGAVAEMKGDNEDLDSSNAITWESITSTISGALSAIYNEVVRQMSATVAAFKGYIAEMLDSAGYFLGFIAPSTGGFLQKAASGLRGVTPNPRAGGPTLGQAKGGIEEPQGPTGGVSDGLSPRVVYGEQNRRVKEAYIVEDRPDNFPYLVEAASWYGMGLTPIKMQGGGVLDPALAKPGATPTDASSAGGAWPPWAAVATPTTGEQLPYTQAAREQYGYMPDGVPAGDWTGADHVNVPLGSTSGELFGGQGGAVSTPWPGLSVISAGGSTASVTPYKSTGPSFAMAAGGTLGGSTSQANPISYQAVPVNWWDTFLGLAWTGDPAVDWPVLYPPSGWDPSQVYSPAAMRRGGILRGGTRYFQGGGLNQAQIEAGLAAGNSALGAFYSYGMAGDDGGFDCAGIWNYIESAVAYGTPQIGKRWGTYEAAGGSAGSFTTPGVTPGGVNIGVDLSGWGPPDGTHMAGDIQDTSFESTTDQGVHNGNSSASFGTQYTMGGAAEVAGMLPAGTVAPPPATMDQTVADWWAATAPAVPDATTGATGAGGPSASASGAGQQVNIKMNANTGNKGGGGSSKSGDITQTQNITSPSPAAATGVSSPASATGSAGGGGTLMDGVQNFMTALPAVTQDYLQNVGQQALGTAGQFNMPPLGNTLDDWIIAALEGAGMDPTPEAIATMSALAIQESGGDPNAVSPDGAQGLFQLMPDTWAAYNAGGDVWDPVANGIASINYQLARYGALVDFSPYAKGGFALAPHLGMVGEAGAEAMIPLENRKVMSQFRANLGMEGMDEAISALAGRVDGVRDELVHQTRVMPSRTGRAMKTGYDRALERDPATRRANNRGNESDARRAYYAGV